VGDEVEVGACRFTAVEVEGRRVRSVRVSCDQVLDLSDESADAVAD